MKVFFKASACALIAAVFLLAGNINANASTGLYVGKDVSGDGTTLLCMDFEWQLGLSAVPEILEKGATAKGEAIKSQNGFEYTLPEDSAKMTLVRNMSYTPEGAWNCCATNEYGVSILSTISTGSCVEAQTADPFVAEGIDEEKIPEILAANSKTAKDAVNLLCSIYDEKGADTAEIVMIADPDGAWVVENFTGHQYVATKLPADKIGVFSNEPVVRTADPDDPDTICSAKLFSLPKENGFAVYDENKNIDLILTYNLDNAYSDEPHLRVWVGHDLFAPSEELDYDPNEGYDAFFTPDENVTIEKAFDFLRNRYEGTPYDLNDEDNDYYWGINNQAVSNAAVLQIFEGVPAEMSTVLWDTPANPTASPFIPIPGYADTIPACFSSDIVDDSYADGTLQYDFIKLNNKAVIRRNTYGASIREFWEGMEAVSANDVRQFMEGKWKESYEDSPVKTVGELNDYIYKIVVGAQENCARITDELDWFMFRTGIRKTSYPDDELTPFTCTFDAVSFAHANGWETSVEGDLFTATKDGKTIEVAISGDNEGNVTFKGYDNQKLMEDFLADDAAEDGNGDVIPAEGTDDADVIPAGETEEQAEEKIEEAVEEVKEEEVTKDSKTKETPAEDEKKEDVADVADADAIAQEAASNLEVDTIADLEAYFAEKIANVPRDGWAEAEIAKELSSVGKDVTKIVDKHFGKNAIKAHMWNEYGPAYAKAGRDFARDPGMKAVREKLEGAGQELSALMVKYFDSMADDVTEDVISGRLNQEGAVKILEEAENDIVGIARLYIEGVSGAFSDVFGDISEEDLKEFLAEVDDAVDVLDEYDVIDQKSVGLDKFDIEDLTEAEVEVVITLNDMDEDVINGLSEMFGVDVKSILDGYMKAFSNAGGTEKIIEEKHETEKAYSEPAAETLTGKEQEQELTEDDIEIPQEVIDILNEAIEEAQSGDDLSGETEEIVSGNELTPIGDVQVEIVDGVFTVSLGKLEKSDGQVLLPSYMLKYFN